MAGVISNRLRALRRARGLTQAELAFLLGVESATTISRIEHSSRPSGLEFAFGCQEIFGLEAGQIYGRLYARVSTGVIVRMRVLQAELRAALPTNRTRAKLKFLEEAISTRVSAAAR
jgi:transcriptional regulator with XRE-family HTH domain